MSKTLRSLLSHHRKGLAEIIRYVITGVATTVVSLGSYYLLTWALFDPDQALELQIANVISWALAVLFAYFANHNFVFRVKKAHNTSEFLKFVSSRLFTLVVDVAIMFIFVTLLHFDNRIVKLGVQFVVMALNYIFGKFLIFVNAKPAPTSAPSEAKVEVEAE